MRKGWFAFFTFSKKVMNGHPFRYTPFPAGENWPNRPPYQHHNDSQMPLFALLAYQSQAPKPLAQYENRPYSCAAAVAWIWCDSGCTQASPAGKGGELKGHQKITCFWKTKKVNRDFLTYLAEYYWFYTYAKRESPKRHFSVSHLFSKTENRW